MLILLTIIHVLACFLLIMAVLLQSGKGGGLASALGGGLSSSSVLGGRSAATFLSKATTILATVFMVSCLVQAIMVRSSETVPTTAIERVMQEGGSLPMGPAPFGGGQVLPGEEGTQEVLPGGEGTQEAAPGAAGQSGEAAESPK